MALKNTSISGELGILTDLVLSFAVSERVAAEDRHGPRPHDAAPPLAAQRDPELARAVRLAQEGSGDSARAITKRLFARCRPKTRSTLTWAFTAAIVAASAPDKRLHLQRIAVEYSQSEWADDALLQLAQLDYAGRDPGGSVHQIDRLLADYPDSRSARPRRLGAPAPRSTCGIAIAPAAGPSWDLAPGPTSSSGASSSSSASAAVR